jgi:Uma2 family endonuclease
MAGVVSFEEQVEIPLDIRSLEDFRRWALSDEFPQRGRIDYLGGRIEVDMSPEDLYCHGKLKVEFVSALDQIVKQQDLGDLFTDATRTSSVPANLSSEPDLVFIAHDAVDSGRVTLIPKSNEEEGRYIEISGAPDLVIEIVSDSSVDKDTKRLPKAYFQAGVREFWLADARSAELLFRIYHRGEKGYVPQTPDAEGYQPSVVLNRRFLLNRTRTKRNTWQYDLLHRPR